MLSENLQHYFSCKIYKPYFAAIGNENYQSIIENLQKEYKISIKKISSFCNGEDKRPNLDHFRDALQTADVDYSDNKLIVLGLGEYLALEGSEKASKILHELKDFNLGTAQAVFLLRGVHQEISELAKSDPRLKERQIYLSKSEDITIRLELSSMDCPVYEMNGFKKILETLESGKKNIIEGNTSLSFPNAKFTIENIHPYKAVCNRLHLKLPKDRGTEEQWRSLLADSHTYDTIEKIFAHYNIESSESMFYENTIGSEYHHWLQYIYLWIKIDSIKNSYLKDILESSPDFETFKDRILNEISVISHTDPKFSKYYQERKKIIKSYPESEISQFISQNRRDIQESLYKLTDTTKAEREEIISYISQHGLPEKGVLETIYPALASYLKSYKFKNSELTTYFDEYKIQKVTNKLIPEFIDMVNKQASSREYNRLPSREELIGRLSEEKKNAFLYWIDALGVEYLGFIEEQAKKKGLTCSVSIGRANLPTITENNRKFYEEWNQDKTKIEELDETKHKDKGRYRYGKNNKYAIHLVKELDIISNVLDEAATKLGYHNYDSIIIGSDHGSSRLAVLHNKEEKYESETKGEHSGRCCKEFKNYQNDLEFATIENGYIVLADYGRFKYSRAANVEVHGGASLEEVIVPIIVLSRKNTTEIKPELLSKNIKADHKKGIKLEFFVRTKTSHQLKIRYNGTLYVGEKTDDTHYAVSISEIRRAGPYEIDVLIGDALVDHHVITVRSQSATMNSDFDNLF